MSSNLLMNEAPLLIQPTLAKLVGLNEAIFLQQLHYWLNPQFNKNYANGRHWVYNTYGKWLKQFPFWGEKTLRRTIAGLEDTGILISHIRAIHLQKTKFYSINYDLLNTLKNKKTGKNRRKPACGQNDQIDLPIWADAGNARLSEGFLREKDGFKAGEAEASEISTDVSSCIERDLHRPVEGENSWENNRNSHLLKARGGNGAATTPSGQNDQMGLPKRADAPSAWMAYEEWEEERQFALENSELPDDFDDEERPSPAGFHFEHGMPNYSRPLEPENGGNSASGHFDQIDVVKMTRSYNKDTKITSENTSPPPKGSSSDVKLKKEEEEEVDLESLVSVWNETVQMKLQKPFVVLTEQRTQALQSIFRTHFSGRPEAWKSYCEKISGTKFLMGGSESGFRVNFDWAINPANVAKVLEGAIYDRPGEDEKAKASVSPLGWEEFADEMRELHVDKGYSFAWTNVCLSLAKQTNQCVAKALFEKIHPENLTNAVARLSVPFQFILDQIRDRHMPKLKAAIRAEFPHVADVSFEVRRAI